MIQWLFDYVKKSSGSFLCLILDLSRKLVAPLQHNATNSARCFFFLDHSMYSKPYMYINATLAVASIEIT